MQSFVLPNTTEIHTFSIPLSVFLPLSLVIICYYRHYENCYYSDCLASGIAVVSVGTRGSRNVYLFNCSAELRDGDELEVLCYLL